MSVRALLRSAGFQAIALPTLPNPQHVNEEGFEYDPADLVSDDIQEDGLDIEDGEVIEVEEEENEEEVVQEDGMDEDVVMQDDEVEEEVVEPLLSFAESLVFPFSLVQTRNHHLTSLLPHIFSHPPIPSHSKPRAKPPPKGTFIFPTPEQLVHPLPLAEYHGPFIEPTASGSGSTPPPPPPPPANTGNSSAKRPARPRKSVGADGEEPPAHEIECISRCILSVGPISFPGTEIWIGRFVLPRQKKKERARPGERKEKRKSMAEESAARRARLSTSSTPRPKPSTGSGSAKHQRQAAAIPRPAPGLGTPTPVRPSTPAAATAPRGTPTPAPARSTASPQLIQLVNQAASRHAWLSALIYKAAGSTANHEELEKLGKAVARLSRGEPIADLAPGYIPPSSAGPSSATISANRPSQPIPSAATGSVSAPSQTTNTAPTVSSAADTSTSTLQVIPATLHAPPIAPAVEAADSDEEPDMKGPPQEGGGPLPLNTTSAIPTSASTEATSSAVTPPLANETVTRVPVRPVERASPAPSPLAATVPMSITSNNVIAQPQSQTRTSMPPPTIVPSTQSPPPPPPIPKPTYPLPPPFLLVAFKEHPTDKYLIPLGSHSFISRVGGDWVTGPKPQPQPEPEVEASAQLKSDEADVKPDILQEQTPAVTPETVIAGNDQEISTAGPGSLPPPPIIVAAGRTRTRPSLGRSAKDVPARSPSMPAPAPPVASETLTTPIPEQMSEPVEALKLRPTSGLPSLPGMKPLPGTILVSTVVPIERWGRVDWRSATKRLPFDNPDFSEQSQIASRLDTLVKDEQAENVPSPIVHTDVAPSTPTAVHSREIDRRSRPTSSTKSNGNTSEPGNTTKREKTGLFNLAAEDLMPSEGSVQPLTIRIEGLDDAAWSKFKDVMDIVESEEIANILRCEPELLDGQMSLDVSGLSGSKLSTEVLDTIRPIYNSRKKEKFSKLLTRVTPRQFLRNRLSPPPPSDIQEAMTDKWAPRPYPISTKPLYVVDTNDDDDDPNAVGNEEGLDISLSLLSPEPESGNGRKKKKDESKVTFEMPVSLDALDERVEQGAARQLSKGKGGKGLGNHKRGEAGGAGGGGRKVKNRRGVEGGICEGCAKKDKIWRRGPGGRGTLCNSCGDLYTNGNLGPLKAPGAMAKVAAPADDGEIIQDGEGESELRKEGDDAIESRVEGQSTEMENEIVIDEKKHISQDDTSTTPLMNDKVTVGDDIDGRPSGISPINDNGKGTSDQNPEEETSNVEDDGGGGNTVAEEMTTMDVDP